MRIKKYIAKSMREAYEQIKAELGEDAVVLKHRKVSKMFGGEEFEVTAGIDDDASAPHAQSFAPLHMSNAPQSGVGAAVADAGTYGRPRPTLTGGIEPAMPEPAIPEPIIPEPAAQPSVRPFFPPSRQPAAYPTKTQGGGDRDDDRQTKRDSDEISEIKANMQELKELVRTVLTTGGAATKGVADDGGWDAFVKRLTDSEVKPEIAKRLISSIRGGSGEDLAEVDFEEQLSDALSDHFPTSGPLKLKKGMPLKVAFVGPTGSGKTTTLAKLAAHCCFNKSKRISIITADTYRIAAVEQIRTFADIVSVGLQIVFSPDEIPAALEACAGSDVVFVDTAGRSQKNKEHMEELRLLMDVLRPDETHLVLSATTKDSDLLDMVHNYRNIRVNRLLFTKLDETSRLGNIFNIVSELGIPVSYFTVGQSVPDDIELAQAGKFVKRLMEGRAL